MGQYSVDLASYTRLGLKILHELRTRSAGKDDVESRHSRSRRFDDQSNNNKNVHI